MSNESTPRRSAVWLMGWMVLLAWVGCGFYRREVPPLTVARAVVRVPSATDLESLCQQPGFVQSAVELLEAEGDFFVVVENGNGPAKLSGKLSAVKTTSARGVGLSATSTPETDSIPMETWELTYRTALADRALIELTSLVTVMQQHLFPARTAVIDSEPQESTEMELLDEQRRAVRQELEQSGIDSATPADPSQLLALQERVRTLQRTLIEAQTLRLQAEEEWRLVTRECRLKSRLDAVAAKLPAGPVQKAVLETEQHRKMSAELTRLNLTEQRLENVYGDNHPKLIEVRGRFEQLLSDLGGWDQVLDESHVTERLDASLDQVVHLKQQHEADLRTQLELEQGELTALNQGAQQRAKLTAELEQLDREVAAIKASKRADSAQGFGWAVQQEPVLTDPDWYSDLTLLMACATSAGIILGWMLHRMLFSGEPRSISEPTPPPVPIFAPSAPESYLDLAQRRALRQARLQQTYAA